MALKSSTKVETNRYQLEITVDGEAFGKAVSSVYAREGKKMAIPGFRKGKAPRNVIEKMYGTDIFYEEAMEMLYSEALALGAEEAGVKIVNDKIDLDVTEVGAEGFTFKATVTVEPEVSIEDYKSIKYKAMSTDVDDAAVDAEIDKEREKLGRLITVEGRKAQNGDTVVIDFEGFLDGEAFPGGKAENYNLALGGGQFIPGFEEQIVGHGADEEFSIFVTFPEDYQAEELKGKETEFKIKLHEIKARELPELDDDFVKDVSDKETLAEYKAEIEEKLKKSRLEEAEKDKDNQIAEQLVGLLQAEIPEAMFKNKAKDLIKDLEARIKSQGLDFKTYLKYMGTDEEGLIETYIPQAETSVKLRLALDKVAELEKIEISADELQAEFEKIAEAHKMDVETVKSLIVKEDLENDLKAQKAIELVKQSAKPE